MHWVPLIVWIAALVVAILVLGYFAYDISGKTKRLRGDLTQLQSAAAQLQSLQQTLGQARERVTNAAQPPASR